MEKVPVKPLLGVCGAPRKNQAKRGQTSAAPAQDCDLVALQDKEEAMADIDELQAAVAQWVEAFHTCHFERSNP